jgi:hypothetical protein
LRTHTGAATAAASGAHVEAAKAQRIRDEIAQQPVLSLKGGSVPGTVSGSVHGTVPGTGRTFFAVEGGASADDDDLQMFEDEELNPGSAPGRDPAAQVRTHLKLLLTV